MPSSYCVFGVMRMENEDLAGQSRRIVSFRLLEIDETEVAFGIGVRGNKSELER